MSNSLKNTAKSELHRMLFDLCENVPEHYLDRVDGLADWYGFQVTQRALERQAIKKRALEKLNAEERDVLGYGHCDEDCDDEDC